MDRVERGFLVACAIAVLFGALQTWLGFWKFEIYRAGVDAGIFTQVILSIGSCFCTTAEGSQNHLFVHWSPVLIAGYPFLRIFGDARGLIVLQAFAVGATAIPLYGIARLYLDQRPSAALTGVAMLYPVFWAQTFTDFHENAFAPALSAALAWAVASRRLRAGTYIAAALLLVKEDQMVFLSLIGIILYFQGLKRDPAMQRFGLRLTCVAVLLAIGYFLIFRPLLHAPPYMSFHLFSPAAPGSRSPEYVGWRLPERLEYIFWALLPLLFMPLGSRLFWLAVPGFVEVLASHQRVTLALNTHYSMVWSGYVAAAFIAAAAYAIERQRAARIMIPVFTTIACIAVLLYHDPMERWYYLYRTPDASDALLRRVVASLPTAQSLGASDMIFAHAAVRSNAITGVRGDYYVADEALGDPTWEDRDKADLDSGIQKGTYAIIFRRGGIIVARRTSR